MNVACGNASWFFFFTFTHMFIHCLDHLPLPPHPCFQAEPVPHVLRFCWRENIRDNKKDIAFLLVWGKDSYTERFLALLPCTCVLQPTLGHLYKTSSPSHSDLCQFKITWFTPLQYINHIQVLGFLPFLYSSCACSPLGVWSMSNNITAFVLSV
jgi:hypothetical protein